MRPNLACLALAALCLMASLPAADAAIHDVRWTSSGIATTNDGSVYLIDVHYNGIYAGCNQGFVVTLKTLTGAVVERRSFAGYQLQNALSSEGLYQQSFTDTGASLDPSVVFNYMGLQMNTINSAIVHQQTQVLKGTYQATTFIVYEVAAPWDFGC